jgi:hypothetical protein
VRTKEIPEYQEIRRRIEPWIKALLGDWVKLEQNEGDQDQLTESLDLLRGTGRTPRLQPEIRIQGRSCVY